jgi:hypothetical protein
MCRRAYPPGVGIEGWYCTRGATGRTPPNNPLELTAHSAGFWGYSRCFLLWAAAQRER